MLYNNPINYPIDQQAIGKILPHAGSMILLEQITSASADTLYASTQSHLDKSNPLLLNKQLNSINGIEYAAQAMAIHAHLIADTTQKQPQSGYLATVRNTTIDHPYLSQSKSELIIKVIRIMADQKGFSYNFQIYDNEQSYISGRITIILQ